MNSGVSYEPKLDALWRALPPRPALAGRGQRRPMAAALHLRTPLRSIGYGEGHLSANTEIAANADPRPSPPPALQEIAPPTPGGARARLTRSRWSRTWRVLVRCSL